MENRVLTLDEVWALPDGARVYGEERDGIYVQSKPYTKAGNCLVDDDGGYYDITERGWNLAPRDEHEDFRVWSLPQPPTPDELAANPWPEKEAWQ